MRLLRRAGILALTLLFGVPAAALLLVHLGIIALPQDALLNPVTEISADSSGHDDALVLERLNTADTPRSIVARAAIREAAAYLPGHREGVERDWAFYSVSRPGLSYEPTIDALASARLPCDSCSAEREERVMVSARVAWMRDDRAEVTLGWGPGPEGRRTNARTGAGRKSVAGERGRLRITLQLVNGAWHALRIEPHQ